MFDKPLEWIGSSKEDLMDFPAEVQRKAGFELRSIQQGDIASDFKPMSIVGSNKDNSVINNFFSNGTNHDDHKQ